MNARTMTVLLAGLISAAAVANAAPRSEAIRIKILDSETHSTNLDDSGVPKNCDGLNYDAYCHSSQTTQVTNTLLAQEDSQPPFRIACTVDSKWSRCASLEKGQSFDARMEKHGVVVYFEDEQGKARKQLYAFVDAGAPNPALPEPTRTTPSASSPAAEVSARPASAPAEIAPAMIKCRFTSAPQGADIALDGHYVGSTPSVLTLSTGVHSVVISMPGFAHWNRQMTVSAGADLTVNAILEKTQ